MSAPFNLDERGIEFENDDFHRMLLAEVCKAYSECPPQSEENPYDELEPCFHFTNTAWFTDGIALRHAYEAMDGCGGFVADEVTPVTREIGETLDYVRVAVGRYHEPVLYIESESPFDVSNTIEPVAVSVSVIDIDEVGICREIQGGGGVTPHEACDHGQPPVHVENEVVADPGRGVVRADF